MVYYGVKAFSYYLCMMKFIVETDHKNLLYMEQLDAYIGFMRERMLR